METENYPSVSKVAMKWGLITGVVFILYSLILNLLGEAMNRGLGSVVYLFLIIFIVLAHKEFKQERDGFMTYGQGLGIGTLMTLIASVLNSIFSFVYMKFIDPSLLTTVIEQQTMEMEAKGTPQAQIDMATSFINPTFIAIMAVVFIVLIGFILSLIITAFTKNSNPEMTV